MAKTTVRRRAPKKKVPRGITAREALRLVDHALASMDPVEARRLWDVLSALRGPDSQQDELKCRTTAIIRRAAFPRATTALRHFVAVAGSLKHLSLTDQERNFDHFGWHAEAAAKVLGLAVDRKED